VAVESLAEAAKGAGFDVKVVPSKTPGELNRDGQRVVTGPGKLTPSELGDLAEARTIVQGTGPRTLQGAESDVRPSSGKRTALVVGVAFAVIGIAVAVGMAVKQTGPAPELTHAADPVISAHPPEPTVGAAPAVSSAPAVTPAPADVEVTVQSTPAGADVYLGNEKLGKAPGPIRMKRSEDKVKLTLKVDGYKPSEVEVTPSANAVISVTLVKIVAGPVKKKPGTGELEF
jgi:hypothetical protein